MSRAYRTLIRHGLRRGLPSRAGFSRRDFLRGGALTVSAATLASLALRRSGCCTCILSPPLQVVTEFIDAILDPADFLSDRSLRQRLS